MTNPYRRPEVGRSWLQHMQEKPDSYHIRFNQNLIGKWLQQSGPFQTVLEVGCGDGFLSQLPQLQKSIYTGIDDSAVFIEHAQQNLKRPNIHFQQADLLSMDLQHKYDRIFSVMVWSELENIQVAFTQLKKHLSDKGQALVVVPSLKNPEIWYSRGQLSAPKTLEIPYGHEKFGFSSVRIFLHSERELKEASLAAGLKFRLYDDIEPLLAPDGSSPYSAIELLKI
ncbi:class I SAM-dependent methyltransferase [Pseudobdellovibrio exovorus]|uniref:Methyltransferase domain-containing protein n=1 Tax=Pseudobdellovibrio exovorus JSS TaxID=1184267 RepID=M4VFD2_9BACT|nr:class I SAM-dependent methyltransferase [Pseudobdellovibrio exovorus]AGH96761.1 hypothetical protein A11Q_2545 [Pseudobdellovibrio exovorus JSS]